MRKIFALLLVMLLVFPGTLIYAHAAENVYRLDDLGLSVTIPWSLATFTRDTKSTDPNFNTFGLNKEQLDSLMEEKDIYLNALAMDWSYEIIVTMSKISMDDFYLLSDAELSDFIDTLIDGYAEMGVEVLESEIYEHPQAKFIKAHLKFSSDNYGMQYYTIYDGKAISFNLRNYSGKLTTHQKDVIEQVVDSIQFDITPQKGAAKRTGAVASTKDSIRDRIIIGGISGALTGAGATLYSTIKKKRGQKAEAGKGQSQPVLPAEPYSSEVTAASSQEDEEVLFCRMCGAKLPKGSTFCYKCGEKV